MKTNFAQPTGEHDYKIAANLNRLKKKQALAASGDVAANKWCINHFAHYIELAKEGHPEYARWVLTMFCRTVSNHRLNKAAPTKFNEELLDFVAGAIKAILEDVSPKKALGLAKDINRPPIDPDTKLNRDVVICNAVARLVSQLKKSGTDYTMKEVKAQAAKELKLGPGTVIAAWKNKSARALAKDFPDLIKGWSM